ncbi:MAG: hypothetical protein KatS3mg057_0575 [Herpetosiphonaceae bacterium]|nr:MAG: hypothetical protein KatS3mg057_0575 [Herpetosiphonaceae bacterium]
MSEVADLFDPAFLRTLDRLTLITRRPLAGVMQGERRSPRRGASVEFADYKPYVPGDDFRQIDWNLYARLERFFLKLFVAEEEVTLHLLVDASASMDWGHPNKLRYALRAAGSLGYIALASLDRVAVQAFGGAAGAAGRQRPVRGRAGALPLLNFLSRVRAAGSAALLESCRRYAQTAGVVGPLLLCSDLLDERWREALAALRRRPFEITVLHILSPDELAPAFEGDLRLVDIEGGEPVEVSADVDLLERYQERLAGWRSEIETYCAGHDINYIFVPTTIPLEELLLDILQRRGVLR